MGMTPRDDKVIPKVIAASNTSSSAVSSPEEKCNGTTDSPESLQDFLRSFPKNEHDICSSFVKDKKQLGLSKYKMSEQKITGSKGSKNMESKKGSANDLAFTSNHCPRKQPRKGDHPIRVASSVEDFQDSLPKKSLICKNSACRAVLATEDTFCKRCSCCICHVFDDNKDPSLWLVCTSEPGYKDSCGLSCHIECALQNQKVGVVSVGQYLQLDGSYCCASCGKITGIIDFTTNEDESSPLFATFIILPSSMESLLELGHVVVVYLCCSPVALFFSPCCLSICPLFKIAK